MQLPRIGDTVHYVSYGTPVRKDGSQAYVGTCRAAIITDVPLRDEPHVTSLCVLNPEGMFFNRGVDHAIARDEPEAGGTWHHLTECGGAQ